MTALLIIPALLVGYLYGRRTSRRPGADLLIGTLVEHVAQPWPKDDVNEEASA